jgi:hypothetical protein
MKKDKLDVQGIRGLYIQWILRVMVFCQKNRKYFGGFMMQLQGEKTMAEKEYIERGAILKRLRDFRGCSIECNESCPVTDCYEGRIIMYAPAADVAEVVHAEWIPHEHMSRTPYARNYDCSECGISPIECENYCPNCGAKMDGERKERDNDNNQT